MLSFSLMLGDLGAFALSGCQFLLIKVTVSRIIDLEEALIWKGDA